MLQNLKYHLFNLIIIMILIMIKKVVIIYLFIQKWKMKIFLKLKQKKVIYVKNGETFSLKLQISGQTILQNLVLTAKASHNGEPTPIKCQWRRMKSDSERSNIKKINSFSYMPNAQDIGYWIEVEVESLDEKNDIAIARYGEISIDKDIRNIITELISYEKKCFNLKNCNENIINNNNYVL